MHPENKITGNAQKWLSQLAQSNFSKLGSRSLHDLKFSIPWSASPSVRMNAVISETEELGYWDLACSPYERWDLGNYKSYASLFRQCATPTLTPTIRPIFNARIKMLTALYCFYQNQLIGLKKIATSTIHPQPLPNR